MLPLAEHHYVRASRPFSITAAAVTMATGVIDTGICSWGDGNMGKGASNAAVARLEVWKAKSPIPSCLLSHSELQTGTGDCGGGGDNQGCLFEARGFMVDAPSAGGRGRGNLRGGVGND